MVEMNGKILRDKKLTELKEKIKELDCQLGLAVIQVGDNEASKVYVRQKEKLALVVAVYESLLLTPVC